MSELAVRGVVKSFGATTVLRGVDLSVPKGALAAVLGPSGCGKTTLLRVVAGFDRADAGEVVIGGRLVSGPGVAVPPERRRVGMVPQEGALFPHLSVAGNVGFGLPRRQRTSRVAEMLDLVGLGGYGARMPHELSGGQQQRVALARALAPGPALVLLDEPFSALDTGLRAALREDVRRALHATGATAVLVTHDQQEALSTADLVAVLQAGTIVQAGPPAELYQAPRDLDVATFLGEAVLLDAVLRGADVADCALGT
ncbi:MAG: ABC transporter ATP-binding protein, partial [Pseudonocardiaceae bacterium]